MKIERIVQMHRMLLEAHLLLSRTQTVLAQTNAALTTEALRLQEKSATESENVKKSPGQSF